MYKQIFTISYKNLYNLSREFYKEVNNMENTHTEKNELNKNLNDDSFEFKKSNFDNIDVDDEFEKKIKEKINFQNILNKNFKKNANTPVSEFLKPTTQVVLDKEVGHTISKVKEKTDNQEVLQRMDRLEGLIQSIIINQTNVMNMVTMQAPTVKDLPKQNIENEATASNKKNVNNSVIAAAIIIVIPLLAIILKSNPSSEVKPSQIVDVKEQETKVIAAPTYKKLVATKFLNLRENPSIKANIAIVISPNSVLELIQDGKDWKKVKFTDFVQGKSHTGWIFGENLKEIKK